MDLARSVPAAGAGAGICGAGLVRQGGGPESGRSGLPLERHHSPFGSFLETLDFTQTYLASRPALVIRWDEVEQYQTAEQLKGKTVAVEAGSAAGRALRWHACRTCQWLLWAARRQLWRKSKKGLAQGAVVDHLVAQAAVEAHRGADGADAGRAGDGGAGCGVAPRQRPDRPAEPGPFRRCRRTVPWIHWRSSTGSPVD